MRLSNNRVLLKSYCECHVQLNRHVGGRGMQALSLIAFLLFRNRLLQLTLQLRKVRIISYARSACN